MLQGFFRNFHQKPSRDVLLFSYLVFPHIYLSDVWWVWQYCEDTEIFGKEFCSNETNSHTEIHTDYWHETNTKVQNEQQPVEIQYATVNLSKNKHGQVSKRQEICGWRSISNLVFYTHTQDVWASFQNQIPLDIPGEWHFSHYPGWKSTRPRNFL